MLKFLISLLVVLLISGCQKKDTYHQDLYHLEECQYNWEVTPPPGFTLTKVTEFNFNGSIRELEFINEEVGYALGRSNIGGYAVVFKTTNGGRTWDNLEIAQQCTPTGLYFRDEDEGFITIHDVT